MASSAKDIQLRELKDTVSQLKTMIAEQTELIKALRLIIDEKTSHEKDLKIFRDSRISSTKQKWNRIRPCWKAKR